MKQVTKEDIGKDFILDNRVSSLVRLFDIQADNWAKIITQDGRHINVTLNRLSPVPSEEALDSIIDLLDYPEKPSKVIIEITKEDGTVVVKTLEGEEAIKWNMWMRTLCYKASELGVNPPWLNLNWKISQKAPLK